MTKSSSFYEPISLKLFFQSPMVMMSYWGHCRLKYINMGLGVLVIFKQTKTTILIHD